MTTPIGVPDFVPATVSVPADVELLSVISGTLPPGANVVSSGLDVTSPSYLIGGTFECTGATTKPFPLVTLQWQDSASGVELDYEAWTVAANTGPVTANIVQWFGRGPTKADTLIIDVDNPDPSVSLTYWMYVYQSSRVVTRADWRSPGLLSPPGYTLAGGDPSGLILASENGISIPSGGGSETWLMPLFAGQAVLTWSFGVSQLYQFVVTSCDPTVTNAQVLNEEITAISGQFTFALPRSVCTLEVLNRGADTETASWTVVAQEFAS